MIETMVMTSSSTSAINGISPIIVGSIGFTTTNLGKGSPVKSTYHIQNQQNCNQQNQESTNGFHGKSTISNISNGMIVRNGSSCNINMPQAIGNGKNRNGSTTTIDDNNDDSSSNGSTCIILPSMTINSQSKTPYSDATQVRITGDK